MGSHQNKTKLRILREPQLRSAIENSRLRTDVITPIVAVGHLTLNVISEKRNLGTTKTGVESNRWKIESRRDPRSKNPRCDLRYFSKINFRIIIKKKRRKKGEKERENYARLSRWGECSPFFPSSPTPAVTLFEINLHISGKSGGGVRRCECSRVIPCLIDGSDIIHSVRTENAKLEVVNHSVWFVCEHLYEYFRPQWQTVNH